MIRPRDNIRMTAYLVSAVAHVIVVLVVPGIGDLKPDFSPKWVEVDLIPEITEMPEIVPSDTASRGTRGSGMDAGDTLPVQGDSPLFPSPPIWLPAKLADIDREPPTQMDTVPGNLALDIAGDGMGVPGHLASELGSLFDALSPASEIPPDMDWTPDISSKALTISTVDDSFPIEGPVSKRQIIYRPPAPQPDSNISGSVQLKFWVRSNGTVGKIVPIVRSDPSLEKASIDFLERWRFEAVSSGSEEQWGILSIRFKLQ